MEHKDWCKEQKGCIRPGAKPCDMCKRAYSAGKEQAVQSLVEALLELAGVVAAYAIGPGSKASGEFQAAVKKRLQSIVKRLSA